MKKFVSVLVALGLIVGGYSLAQADSTQTTTQSATTQATTTSVEYKTANQILEKDINYVSEYTLIGSPSLYDGKKIRVVGKFHYDITNSALYVSSEDYNLGITKNALWCVINPKSFKISYNDLKALDNKYVMIEGTFNGLNSGQKNYSGSIANITRIKLWDKQN